MKDPHVATAVLDAIDEPALIVRASLVEAANQAALALLGGQIIGRDLRFAIRWRWTPSSAARPRI